MSECDKQLAWLGRLNKIYQPVKGFEYKIKEERVQGFNRILDSILDYCGDVEGQRFLDVGSNLGWFCFQLTELGAETTGIELDKRRSDVCKCLSKRDGFEEGNPRFINGNVVEWLSNTKETFDYVLNLNVFHHILLQNEEKGWDMFNRLIKDSDIFVMMRNQLKTWRLCDKRTEIPEAVLRVSDASHFMEYPAVHGRAIYVFS